MISTGFAIISLALTTITTQTSTIAMTRWWAPGSTSYKLPLSLGGLELSLALAFASAKWELLIGAKELFDRRQSDC